MLMKRKVIGGNKMSEELKNKDGSLNKSKEKEVKENRNFIREKVINFWNKLNIFNKFATIGISVFILLGLIAFFSNRIVSGIIAIISIILIVVSILIEKQVIKNTKKIREYINNQLKEDCMADQISFSEYIDPFTGEKVKENK